MSQFYKTKWCPFFTKGFCKSGDLCTYAHYYSELREKKNLTKTTVCKAWLQSECQDKNCKFAHGWRELRNTNSHYKTKVCTYFEAGSCNAGHLCRHAHGKKELRIPDNFTSFKDDVESNTTSFQIPQIQSIKHNQETKSQADKQYCTIQMNTKSYPKEHSSTFKSNTNPDQFLPSFDALNSLYYDQFNPPPQYSILSKNGYRSILLPVLTSTLNDANSLEQPGPLINHNDVYEKPYNQHIQQLEFISPFIDYTNKIDDGNSSLLTLLSNHSENNKSLRNYSKDSIIYNNNYKEINIFQKQINFEDSTIQDLIHKNFLHPNESNVNNSNYPINFPSYPRIETKRHSFYDTSNSSSKSHKFYNQCQNYHKDPWYNNNDGLSSQTNGDIFRQLLLASQSKQKETENLSLHSIPHIRNCSNNLNFNRDSLSSLNTTLLGKLNTDITNHQGLENLYYVPGDKPDY